MQLGEWNKSKKDEVYYQEQTPEEILGGVFIWEPWQNVLVISLSSSSSTLKETQELSIPLSCESYNLQKEQRKDLFIYLVAGSRDHFLIHATPHRVYQIHTNSSSKVLSLHLHPRVYHV